MSKTAKKAKKPVINPENPEAAAKLSHVYLGFAMNETLAARYAAKECEYSKAQQALNRRDAFLQAALVAKERGL
jgi:phosphopantetheinyl transferase (holo-ACP synthase)